MKVESDLARDISRAAGGPRLYENAHARAAIDHDDGDRDRFLAILETDIERYRVDVDVYRRTKK